MLSIKVVIQMSKDITIYFSSKEQVISSGAAALAAAFDYAKNHQILLPVSYTHLDVYKRQGCWCVSFLGCGLVAGR